MAFHDVRFPLDVALGSRGGPQRLTEIVTLASGAEARNSRWAQSRRRYDAGYGVKSLADMRAVLAFFEERRGRFHGFRWRDGLDFSSRDDDAAPTAFDQAVGVGDGETTAFALSKTYGASFDPYRRPITKPVAGTVRVGLGGAEVTSGFTVSYAAGTVSFATAPGAGIAVTAGFLFDVPVRFDTDRLDVELAGFDAARVPSIPLVEVRA